MLPNDAPPTWPDLAYWRATALQQADELAALKRERDALRMELEIARTLVCELSRRPPLPPTDSTRAAVATAPFPARALRTWNTPEIWR